MPIIGKGKKAKKFPYNLKGKKAAKKYAKASGKKLMNEMMEKGK